MQISRHWRMNSQRYRLEGVRYDSGDVSLEDRPIPAKAEVSEDVIDTVAMIVTKQGEEVAA